MLLKIQTISENLVHNSICGYSPQNYHLAVQDMHSKVLLMVKDGYELTFPTKSDIEQSAESLEEYLEDLDYTISLLEGFNFEKDGKTFNVQIMKIL